MPVYITARGDRYHAAPDCGHITGPQNTARTMGWTVHPAEEVTRAEAKNRGKSEPCPTCGPIGP
ncbi:hypothetical protein [Streptomyces sp. CC219B]|uniref:hypothetical protein n=1 Tax=Streptomyces sp. CC219B TaxID=3044574 RepID=UPI0024A9AFF4|nr:hypothetical protein [Streptomyces sp. CC219B]